MNLFGTLIQICVYIVLDLSVLWPVRKRHTDDGMARVMLVSCGSAAAAYVLMRNKIHEGSERASSAIAQKTPQVSEASVLQHSSKVAGRHRRHRQCDRVRVAAHNMHKRTQIQVLFVYSPRPR